jgi:hypothetical protein
MKSKPLANFAGVNNRRPDTALLRGEDEAHWLKDAVNVDLDNAGGLRRRQGYRRVVEGVRTHSIWSGKRTFYMERDCLYQLKGTWDNPATEEILYDLTPDAPMSFADIGEDTYFSNGYEIGVIDKDGNPHRVWPEQPNWQPAVSGESGGALAAGLYQVCCTVIGWGGRQSPPTRPVQVSVPENGALTITLPVAGDLVAIYATPPNGDVFYKILETTGANYRMALARDGGERCFTEHLMPMPPGTIVRGFLGRLLVASGKTLYFSEPYSPGLYNPVSGFLQFASDITMLEPCGKGFYLAADKTYWFSGDLSGDAVLSEALPYGAAVGSGVAFPDREQVAWYSNKGVVVGDASGQAKAVQEEAVVVKPAAAAALLIREEGGQRAIVAAAKNPGRTVAAAHGFFHAEHISN